MRVSKHLGLSRRRLTAAFLASSALGIAGTAAAQGVPQQQVEADAASVPGDIIVTATKRSENIQNVPISIQALGTATLEQHQVQNLDDYVKLLPSVSYQSAGPGQSQLQFRGISTGGDGLHSGPLPTAGLYIDETSVTTIAGAVDIHVYDIARVEALSGPQGTLYGASSLSGTLRLITNKPDSSKFSAGYDLQGNKFGKGDFGGQAEGFVNIPLGERAAIRLVGFYERDGGYIDNTPATRTYQRPHTVAGGAIVNAPLTIDNSAYAGNDFNDVETYGGRAALKFDLDDNWTVTPGILYQHQEANGTFQYDPKAGDLDVHNFKPSFIDDNWYLASLTVQGKVSDWDVVYSGSYFRRKVDVATDYSYFNVAYDSYANYNFIQDALGRDIDPTQGFRQHDTYTKLSQELRVSSPSENRFRLTAGLFMQRQTDQQRQEFQVEGLRDAVIAFSPAIPGAGPDDLYFQNIHRVDRDYAMFGEAAFDILPNLTLNAGIRGFIAKNTLAGFAGGIGAILVQPGCVAQTALACPNVDKTYDESGETHKVNLTWKIDPQRLIYATYSTGFRPGGNNRDIFAARRFQIIPPYQADRLTNYEIGWKTSWFDRTLRINGALFWDEWNKIQYTLPGLLGINYVVNAGKARSRGIEGDVSWTIARKLTLSAAGTYLDAELTQPFCDTLRGCDPATGGRVLAPSGTSLPNRPKLKVNGTARYEFETGTLRNFLQGSVLHQGGTRSFLTSAGEAILGPTKQFTTFDFAVGTAFNNMTISLFIENAFDKRGVVNKGTPCAPTICGANIRLYPIKPQFFGIKLGQRF